MAVSGCYCRLLTDKFTCLRTCIKENVTVVFLLLGLRTGNMALKYSLV